MTRLRPMTQKPITRNIGTPTANNTVTAAEISRIQKVCTVAPYSPSMPV